MILVTAANGNQGKLLLPKLLASGFAVRACVHSQASAEALSSQGVSEVVVGDISQPQVIARALEGVSRIYHIGPTAHPAEREMGFCLIDAAAAAGVEHFVFSSVLHAIESTIIQHKFKRDIEEHLLASGVPFTILQPANYMTPGKLDQVFEHGVYSQAWGLERRQSLVDLADVADVVLSVLSDPQAHIGATYELAGEGRYTARELADVVAAVTGGAITVEQTGVDALLRKIFGDVDSSQFEHQIAVLKSIMVNYDHHDFIGNPNVLSWLLGRPPTSYRAFVEREFARWSGDPSNGGTLALGGKS